jgi:hypothetical protein
MLKTFYIVAIVASVSLVASLTAISYLSSPPPGHSSEQQGDNQAAKEKQAEQRHSISGFIRYLFPDGIAVFTFWLVIATIVLGVGAIVQIGYLERAETISAGSSQTAKESAEAAKKAANIAEKSLTELERPYVFVQIPKFVPNTIPGRPDRVQYVLKNYGRTPAIVRWFKAEAKRQVANEGGWSNFFNGQIILASGEEREFEVVGGGGMNPYPKSDPLSTDPNQTALLNIEVTYSDVFDYFHVSGFSFFERGGTFYAIGGNQYNRRKSAKLPPGTEWTPAWSDEP